MAKVCISGYYGYDSIGNELVLMSMVNALRQQSENMEIVVFSGNPAKTREDFDVIAVDRDDWNMVKNELKTADLLISGGGHLLKETANMDVLKYYLKVIKTALQYKCTVFIFNQMIGPLTSSRTKNMVAKIMKKVQKITVADKDSADLLHSLGIRRGRIHVVEDPVLAMTDFQAEWNLTNLSQAEEKQQIRPLRKENEANAPINYDGMEVEIEIHIVEPEPEAVEASEEVSDDTIEIIPVDDAEIVSEDAGVTIERSDEAVEESAKSGEDVVEVAPEAAEELAAAAAERVPEEETEKASEKEAAEDAMEEEAIGEEAMEDSIEEETAEEEDTPKANKEVLNRPHNLGLVVPSFWKKPGEKFVAFTVSPKTELPVTQITAMADYMYNQGYQVVFLPVKYPDDVLLAKDIIAMMKNPAYEVEAKMSPQSLLTAINEVDFVFSSEIYPMMLAAICKKPFASLCASGRALDFVMGLGLTPTGNLLAYDGDAFIRNFKAAVAHPEVIVSAIETNLPDMQEKAEYGMSLLRLLFEQIERRKIRAERGKMNRSKERQMERRSAQARSVVGANEEAILPQTDEDVAVADEDVVVEVAEIDTNETVMVEKADETEKEA